MRNIPSKGVTRLRPYYFDPVKLTGHDATMRANTEGGYVSWEDYRKLHVELLVLAELIWQNASTEEAKHWARGIKVSMTGDPLEPGKLTISADETSDSVLRRFAEWAAGASCDDEYAPRMVKHIAAIAKDALTGNADIAGYPAGIGPVETRDDPNAPFRWKCPACTTVNAFEDVKCVGCGRELHHYSVSCQCLDCKARHVGFRMRAEKASEQLPEPNEEQSERLSNYIQAYQKLSDMPAKELVDLVLEHVIDIPPMQNLLLEELCTRVHPNWPKECNCGQKGCTTCGEDPSAYGQQPVSSK